MPAFIHICKPLDTTQTFCGRRAAQVAAANYADKVLCKEQTLFCPDCETRCKEHEADEG